MLLALGAALLLAFAIPLPAFAIARRFCSVHDAAALAATYGSVSAVTFLTACASLDRQGAPYGGHMVAAMALMKSPGIIVAVLLLGSLLIGALCGERGMKAMSPLCKDLFPGVLVFFLLDLGVLAGGRMRELRQRARFLVPFAVLLPLLHAALALGLAWLLRRPPGDATLLATLAASA